MRINRKPRGARVLGVVEEVELAFSRRNRLATALGIILGGVIPVATYVEAHLDLDTAQPLYAQPATFLVAGGLLFSAKTVFTWCERAFRDGWKAAGFVVLLEGVMITSAVPVLPVVLLGILVAINGIATGCSLSLDRRSERVPAASRVMTRVAEATRQHVPSNCVGVDAIPPTLVHVSRSAPRRTRRMDDAQNRFAFATDAS
jgi:hypothetical protein